MSRSLKMSVSTFITTVILYIYNNQLFIGLVLKWGHSYRWGICHSGISSLKSPFTNIGYLVISANTAASPIGQALILIIMYVEIFKTDLIVYICNVIMRLMSHWATIFPVLLYQNMVWCLVWGILVHNMYIYQ
jgi:hypothetical protein